jgi:competence protein ComEC
MRGSNQAIMAYAQLEKINQDASPINKLTRRFSAGMQNALPEPLASFGMGLLIGQRTNLPQYTLTALSIAGLTHIIAVSGYNLTILVRATSKIKIFGSKFQKLVVSLFLIGTFVLITGFSASIVRASAIAVLGLWAWYYGRKLRPILAITLVAAASGLYNPFYVWSDIGWYLSFTAFFGVLILAPLLAKKIMSQSETKGLAMILVETFSAYIMTLPIIMYIFGKVSVVALLANLLVLPLVPFAMLFSTVAGIAGMFVPAFAGWLALPAKIILTYILDVAYRLSDLGFAQVLTYLSAWQMISIYSMLGFCVAILAVKHLRHDRTP